MDERNSDNLNNRMPMKKQNKTIKKTQQISKKFLCVDSGAKIHHNKRMKTRNVRVCAYVRSFVCLSGFNARLYVFINKKKSLALVWSDAKQNDDVNL